MAAMHIVFDTLKYVEALKKSGVEENQAKAFIAVQKEVLEEVLDNTTLATKSDIVDLKAELKSDIQALKTELKTDIAEIKTDIAKLQIEMRYMRWMLGLIIFGVGSLLVKAYF